MQKYRDPKEEMDKFYKNLRKRLYWWIRPGWVSIILWGLVFGIFIGLIAAAFNSARPVAIGGVAWFIFSGFSIVIRDGKKM